MTKGWVIGLVLLIQAASAAYFLSDILSSLFGLPLPPLAWELVEIMQILASVGLLLGLLLGAFVLLRAVKERRAAEERLRRASGLFMDILAEHFTEWGLTPAEKDVALFAIKGMSTAEIAILRHTSEGTVKAQTNAIYRKAGVSGRSQLLSVFIEDLMRDSKGLAASQISQSAA